MSDLLELEAPRLRTDGKARLFLVQPGQELGVLFDESHMHQTPASEGGSIGTKNQMAQEPKTTVIHVYVKHTKELPPDLLDELASRAYMLLHTKGDEGDAMAVYPEFPKREWEQK